MYGIEDIVIEAKVVFMYNAHFVNHNKTSDLLHPTLLLRSMC